MESQAKQEKQDKQRIKQNPLPSFVTHLEQFSVNQFEIVIQSNSIYIYKVFVSVWPVFV